MRSILRILADIALLPVSGCIFPPNRDCSNERADSDAHPQPSESKKADLEGMLPGVKENPENHPAEQGSPSAPRSRSRLACPP